MNKTTKLAILATAIATLGGAAYAAKSSENDALAINQAKIPIAQAISIAEKQHNGKASQAEFEHTKQGAIYEVEVVAGAKVFDVKVDADKGIILSSAEDKADGHEGRDEDHDEKD
ncbi:PepSY domain-containing protein [Accumulibacter sp.]|uniref:PepSY domain-containing protein n=1 Tax=Accumulibacter sp. TaxID=2053492 RepID=UPI001AD5C9A6|nr:PepSY domain-containing protein [Accumulibacter sp.]MBN8514956.1 PepSY domain-containing protein [Accumulibacter sp.]MBO3702032.1 PepSY domain-containing protein [Accumulibacter sp.]